MIRRDLWKCLLKKESFELGLSSERVGGFRKLAGSEFQTVGAMKLKELSPTHSKLRLGIFTSFSFDDRRVREVFLYVQSEAER